MIAPDVSQNLPLRERRDGRGALRECVVRNMCDFISPLSPVTPLLSLAARASSPEGGASACQKSPKDSMSFRTSPQTGVGIPRLDVKTDGLGSKMFENPGDCARRKSPWGTTAVCALPRNDMVFRQSESSPFGELPHPRLSSSVLQAWRTWDRTGTQVALP